MQPPLVDAVNARRRVSVRVACFREQLVRCDGRHELIVGIGADRLPAVQNVSDGLGLWVATFSQAISNVRLDSVSNQFVELLICLWWLRYFEVWQRLIACFHLVQEGGLHLLFRVDGGAILSLNVVQRVARLPLHVFLVCLPKHIRVCIQGFVEEPVSSLGQLFPLRAKCVPQCHNLRLSLQVRSRFPQISQSRRAASQFEDSRPALLARCGVFQELEGFDDVVYFAFQLVRCGLASRVFQGQAVPFEARDVLA